MKPYFYFPVLMMLSACSSPEDDALDLVGEAQKLYNKIEGYPGQLTEEQLNDCIKSLTLAKGKIDKLNSEYANTHSANNISTKVLAGKINGYIATCERLQKLAGKTEIIYN